MQLEWSSRTDIFMNFQCALWGTDQGLTERHRKSLASKRELSGWCDTLIRNRGMAVLESSSPSPSDCSTSSCRCIFLNEYRTAFREGEFLFTEHTDDIPEVLSAWSYSAETVWRAAPFLASLGPKHQSLLQVQCVRRTP